MKNSLSLLFLCTLALPLSAQMQRGLKGSYNLDNYPEVSFVWNSPNPEPLKSTQFALFENDSAIEFKVSLMPVDKSKAISKSVLVLWEDMASHGRQSDFTRELLTRFFSETQFSSTDFFQVAVFDRMKGGESKVISPLAEQFTSDVKSLAKTILLYQKNGRQYADFPQQTDLYQAINEGIDLLSKEPTGRTGVLVVVTAGLNVKAAGASTEVETVRQKAIRSGIPIYVVKYPLAGNTPEVNMLAESTFGIASLTVDIIEALANLQLQYKGFDDRLRGCDYKFTFTTKGERDGKPHPMRMTVDKMRRPLPPYLAPKITFAMWLKQMWWLATLILLAIVGAVVLAVSLVKKKFKERDDAARKAQEQMRREHEESQLRSREAMENLRREQEAKEQAAREAERLAQLAAQEERLQKLMQTKNLFPRLQCKAGEEMFTYSITKPRTTLGRNQDNDVAFSRSNSSFDNSTVSGHHAEIVFNGAGFELINISTSYTQGVIINGQFYQRYMLNNGDMIGLGEALITFYL